MVFDLVSICVSVFSSSHSSLVIIVIIDNSPQPLRRILYWSITAVMRNCLWFSQFSAAGPESPRTMPVGKKTAFLDRL